MDSILHDTITHHDTRVRRLVVQRPTDLLTPAGVKAMERRTLTLRPGITSVSKEDLHLHSKQLEKLEADGVITMGNAARATVRERNEAIRNTSDIKILSALAQGDDASAKVAKEQIEKIRKPADKKTA